MTLRSTLRSAVENVLGSKYGRSLSHNMARLGLHGLGVGLPPSPESSGERFFLKSFMDACGCSLAIDVGGNVGDYTAMLLELGIPRVITFEPVPASGNVLEARFMQDSRVTIRRQAVGETVETIHLNVPTDNATSVLASRGDGASNFTSAPVDVIQVPMTTLDVLMDELDVMPEFLKIDVEGFEAEVLVGAQKLVRSQCLKAIQIEFSYHHLLRGTTLLTFERHLPGYQLFRMASRSLRALDSKHYLGTIYGFSNFVALRPDTVARLAWII